MRIAVDFDGTLVENEYPGIGVEKPGAVKVLKQLAAEGDQIILWTARSGALLQDAVDWCESQGLKFFAINSNYHTCINHQNGFSGSRKIQADIFIDDRNIGGFPGWLTVYEKITKLKRQIRKEFSQKDMKSNTGVLGRIALLVRSQSRSRAGYMSSIYPGEHKSNNK